ncbi:MAG: sulfite exporter TauE/SafE family protein [Pseudomonadota bacterium]
MEWVAAYLALGAIVGFLAGLFGIGGGLVLVPVLSFLFELQQLTGHENLHLLALGTSMAAILLSALVSSYTHYRHGAVQMTIVRILTPGLLLGTALGTLVASHIDPGYLMIFFALFVCWAALQMLLDIKPQPARPLPGAAAMIGVGTGIGAVSSLVSIGGGTVSVPFLLYHNITLRHAIGTSAALGLPIAVGGTMGYIATGWAIPALPSNSLGFVYVPAWICVALGSVLTVPAGAWATYHLPIKWLRRGFAILLFLLALRMIWQAWANWHE